MRLRLAALRDCGAELPFILSFLPSQINRFGRAITLLSNRRAAGHLLAPSEVRTTSVQHLETQQKGKAMNTRCERLGQVEIGIIEHESHEFAAFGATIFGSQMTATSDFAMAESP